MDANIISVLIGAAAALLLAGIIYRLRHRIAALRSSAEQSVVSTRQRLSRNAEDMYREAVIDLGNSMHVAGHLVPLEKLFVTPSFYTTPPLNDPYEEAQNQVEDPHNLLPVVPEWPQYLAPYHIKAIKVDELLHTNDNIAILGDPGSGRSTILGMLALHVARTKGEESVDKRAAENRLPIYFHLADIDLEADHYEVSADPLDPMLEAARRRLRGFASRIIGAVLGEFTRGNGLILADGWDEIPLEQQRKVAEWFDKLMATYPGNQLIIAGGIRGYGRLQDMGLSPLFLMPWSDNEFTKLGSNWAKAWPEIGGTDKVPAERPTEDLMRRATRGNRARSVLDATLRIWATFAEEDPGEGQRGWYKSYIDRVDPAPELRPALLQMAKLIYESPDTAGIKIDVATAAVDSVGKALESNAPMAAPDYLYALSNETNVLREHTDDYITFAHPVIGAYFTALAINDEGPEFRPELLEDRLSNRLIMPFLAQLQDISEYVTRRLNEPKSLAAERKLEMARWAADADARASWRNPLFKELASLMLQTEAYPYTRERAMAALVASRDLNVTFIFREALKDIEPEVRLLAVLGLGAIADPESVIHVGEMLSDPEPRVVMATGMALGALGTKTALNYMIEMLLSSADFARRGVAEMLATTNIAGEGHEVLREASHEVDAATRKAAVYGLDRLDADWAVERIGEMERLDDDWAVRAAAGIVMDRYRKGDAQGTSISAPPKPEDTKWLAHWLGERNEAPAPGQQGITQLIRVLQEGDEALRIAAAEALGALGAPAAIKPLYKTLIHEHAEIRDTAYRALASISRATGHPLPGVL